MKNVKFMSIPNVIDTPYLEKNKEKANWNGSGTQNNPIIINDNSELPLNITFKTEDLYIHIRDIDINVLILDKCQNIILEDSIISIVKLLSCENIVVRNNLIREIKLFFGKNIVIEKNRIYSFLYMRLFTILMLLISLLSVLLIILSYIEGLFLFRYLGFFLLIIGVITSLFDIIEKKNSKLMIKKFRNNKFVKLNGKKSR